jgi:TATA-binding protein-associated factor Taf7
MVLVELPMVIQVNTDFELVSVLQFFDDRQGMVREDAVIHEDITPFFEVLNQQVVGYKYIDIPHEH